MLQQGVHAGGGGWCIQGYIQGRCIYAAAGGGGVSWMHPAPCGQTDTYENITSPILRIRSVKING